MLRSSFILLLLLFISTPALAQNKEALCKLWATHKAEGTAQSVNYVPGKDVHGNDVVAADLSELPPVIPTAIRIPLTVDLAGGLNVALPEGMEMNAAIGSVAIHSNGRVTYNDQDLSEETVALCEGKEVKKEATPTVEPSEDITLDEPIENTNSDKEEIIWGQDY